MEAALTFEGQACWVGPYNQAVTRFKEPNCGVCYENYSETTQVIVFPCGHMIDERCYERLQGRICPYDRKAFEGISKVSFLSFSIIFPNESRKFGAWLHTHADKVNSWIKEKFIFSEEARLLGTAALRILQDYIYAYDNLLPSEKMEECANEAISKLIFASKEVSNVEEIAKMIGNDNDLSFFVQNKENIRNLSGSIRPFANLLLQFLNLYTRLTFDNNRFSNIVDYTFRLLQVAANNSYFEEIATKVDDNFIKQHMGAIKPLSPGKGYAYLYKLSNSSLERLHLLTKNNEAISPEIKNRISKMHTSQAAIDKIKNVVLMIIMAIVVVAVLQ